jgi:uncharacterized protein (DUF305 family)
VPRRRSTTLTCDSCKLTDAISASQAEIQTMKGWLQRWQQPMLATAAMAHEGEHAPGMMRQGQLDWPDSMAASSTWASRPA